MSELHLLFAFHGDIGNTGKRLRSWCRQFQVPWRLNLGFDHREQKHSQQNDNQWKRELSKSDKLNKNPVKTMSYLSKVVNKFTQSPRYGSIHLGSSVFTATKGVKKTAVKITTRIYAIHRCSSEIKAAWANVVIMSTMQRALTAEVMWNPHPISNFEAWGLNATFAAII